MKIERNSLNTFFPDDTVTDGGHCKKSISTETSILLHLFSNKDFSKLPNILKVAVQQCIIDTQDPLWLIIFFQISTGENMVNLETLVIRISLHVEWSQNTFRHHPNVV